jgi:hypothetical protein
MRERADAYQRASIHDPRDWAARGGPASWPSRAMRSPSSMNVYRLLPHYARPNDRGRDDRDDVLAEILCYGNPAERTSLQEWHETADCTANGFLRLLYLYSDAWVRARGAEDPAAAGPTPGGARPAAAVPPARGGAGPAARLQVLRGRARPSPRPGERGRVLVREPPDALRHGGVPGRSADARRCVHADRALAPAPDGSVVGGVGPELGHARLGPHGSRLSPARAMARSPADVRVLRVELAGVLRLRDRGPAQPDRLLRRQGGGGQGHHRARSGAVRPGPVRRRRALRRHRRAVLPLPEVLELGGEDREHDADPVRLLGGRSGG